MLAQADPSPLLLANCLYCEAQLAVAEERFGAAIAGLLAHWQQTLEQIGFLDPAAPKKLLPRLNQLLNRAQLSVDEVHILRGIARAAAARR